MSNYGSGVTTHKPLCISHTPLSTTKSSMRHIPEPMRCDAVREIHTPKQALTHTRFVNTSHERSKLSVQQQTTRKAKPRLLKTHTQGAGSLVPRPVFQRTTGSSLGTRLRSGYTYYTHSIHCTRSEQVCPETDIDVIKSMSEKIAHARNRTDIDVINDVGEQTIHASSRYALRLTTTWVNNRLYTLRTGMP